MEVDQIVFTPKSGIVNHFIFGEHPIMKELRIISGAVESCNALKVMTENITSQFSGKSGVGLVEIPL